MSAENAERHIREVLWNGELSWLVGSHGPGAYTERRAVQQIDRRGEYAVGTVWDRYISTNNPHTSWGPDVCIWKLTVSDGVRAYHSKFVHTRVMPSISGVTRIDENTVLVDIVGRKVESGPDKGKEIAQVECRGRHHGAG